MEKSLIVAVADNGAIGRRNALLWNLPGDMKYFRRQTTGNAVIMGWMTFQSIGRPLPRRRNIVISLFPWPDAPAGVTVVDSLDAAFAAAEMADQVGHDEKGQVGHDEKAFVIVNPARTMKSHWLPFFLWKPCITNPIPSSEDRRNTRMGLHLFLFTPWEKLDIPAIRQFLKARGDQKAYWVVTDDTGNLVNVFRHPAD